MPTDKTEGGEALSFDDDMHADVMAAFKEVASKAEAVEPVKAAETEAKEAEPAKEPEARDDGRDEKGRFKAKDEKAEATEKAEPEKVEAEPVKAVEPAKDEIAKEPVGAAGGGPPTSWSIKAKAAWEDLPPDVRSAIAKRETEMAEGSAAHQQFRDLKPWAERAQREGTTISKALEHYTGFENVLRQDMGRGLAVIAQNYGYNQQQAAELFAKLAQQFGGGAAPAKGQSNGTAAAEQPDPIRDAFRPLVDPLVSKIEALEAKLTSQWQAGQTAQTQAQVQADQKIVEAFRAKAEHRYFDDVRQDVLALFQSGRVKETGDLAADLKSAYEIAVWQHPEIREALINQRLKETQAAERKKEQEAVEKAKAASRSVTGNRSPGMVVKDKPAANSHDDVEADVWEAMRSHQAA